MKIIYIDESGTFNDGLTPALVKTDKRRSTHFVLSALVVDLENWELVFGRFKKLRADVRHNYKIKKSEHIHAHELVNGSRVWRHIKYKHLTSPTRRRLLKYLLTNYASWPEIKVMTVAVSKLTPFPSIQPDTARSCAYENLFNRLDKTLGDEPYLVINDGQEDYEIIKLLRKMRAFNQVTMSSGQKVDVRIKSLVEDPLFKYSKNSYFLQCIDHIAYATLHIFDERLGPVIGRDLLLSGVYPNLGIKAAHRETASDLPGIVIVPKMNAEDVAKLRKKSLGVSATSSGAGLTR